MSKNSKTVNDREFAMASGEMSEEEFTGFLSGYLACAKAYSVPGALLFNCMDHAHLFELMTAARHVGLEHKQLIVWAKDRAGMGTFYRSQHELILVVKHV